MANGDLEAGFLNRAHILAIRGDGRTVAQYTDSRAIDVDSDGDEETVTFTATPIAGKKVKYVFTIPAGSPRTPIFHTTETSDVALDADIFTEDV
jgi:hypothetical protein